MPPKKRARVEGDWSWVGSEVTGVEGIGIEHRWRAAGLVGVKECPRRSSKTSSNGHGEPSKGKAVRKNPSCTESLCRSHLRCYNHLGVDEVMGSEAKAKFVEKKVGEVPELRNGPAGLKNKGATCYANAFLQLWFHNFAFRNALYSCAITADSRLYHLVRVFGFLQETQRKVVDPSGLVEKLKLNTGDQQDAGEFSKLFMSLIDNELQRQPIPESRNVMSRLFEGKLQYLTRCLGCGAEKGRAESFMELELSLKDGDALETRIQALQQPELLEGDNRYQCGTCSNLCHATRVLQITKLPDIINFTLMRFTYDLKRGERRKSKATIRYPKSAVFLGSEYDLQAVIVHEGSSPYHGHFVCEVLDEAYVMPYLGHFIGRSRSSFSTATWYLCNDEEVTKVIPAVAKKLNMGKSGYESSRDAYMLVYKKRGAAVQPLPPPDLIREEILAENSALKMDRQEWKIKCEAAELEFDKLRDMKAPLLEVISGGDAVIPRSELKRWIGADLEGISKPIDYADLLCEHNPVDSNVLGGDITVKSGTVVDPVGPALANGHSSATDGSYTSETPHANGLAHSNRQSSHIGRCNGDESPVLLLDPAKMINARLVSREAASIIAKHSHLPSNTICPTCVEDGATLRLAKSNREEQVKAFDELNDATDEAPWLIPKKWLQTWRLDTLPYGSKPTDDEYCLYCEHDQPFIKGVSTTPITSEALMLLRSAIGDFKAFTEDSQECQICLSANVAEEDARARWQKEIQRDKAFKREKQQAMAMLDTDYYLFSMSFGPTWQLWLREPGPRPPYASDICEHGGIPYDPEEERGSYLTPKGWRELQDIYGPQQEVVVRIDTQVGLGRSSVVRCTSHETCQPCRRQRLLIWDTTKITIVMSEGDDKVVLGKRKTRSSKSFDVEVENKTTVKELRLKIYRETDISPMSQLLRYEGRLLLEAGQTMEELAVLAGCVMTLSEAEESNGKPAGTEGFAGTALVGTRACPDCTYENDADKEFCEMCNRPLLM